LKYSKLTKASPDQQIMAIELSLRLPELLLQRVDRMTMAASVEARVPFLDEDVVRFCLQLSGRHRIRHGKGKWLLRQVARNRVPNFVLERKKMGFCGSAKTMIQTQVHQQMMVQLQSSAFFKDLLGTKVRNEFLKAAGDPSLLPSQSLWTLYNLAQWGDRWL
ncbi:MAG: hypothetical protein CMH58_02955, partial [Myxococcales bacterium]|nr:hypothetical protein [Myxococcales bacterium]